MKNLLPTVILLLGLSAVHCSDETLEPNIFVHNCEQSLPELNSECESCHDLNELYETHSDEAKGAKQWMIDHGTGLVRAIPAMPTSQTLLAIPWVRRGRHPQPSPGCEGCHPVDDKGFGHGVKSYSEGARNKAFAGGTSCSASCHDWLSTSITEAGFEDSDGNTPLYEGSGRPVDLLNGVTGSHQNLWKNGLRTDSETLRISGFNPGCGGCHHTQAEDHSEVSNCLTCHKFGDLDSAIHLSHTVAISENIDRIDPNRPDMTECAYCHYEEGAPSRGKAGCYNCHLSGHQPLNEQGKPHFWH